MVSNRVRISEPRLVLPPEISRSTTPSGPARSRQRESSSRANADCKTFYWVLTFLLTDGFTFWKAAEKCLIPTPTGLWIEGWSSSLITWLVDRTLIHSRKAAMLASRTNAARSAPLNKARKHEWLLKLYKVETKENSKVEQRSKIRRLDTTSWSDWLKEKQRKLVKENPWQIGRGRWEGVEGVRKGFQTWHEQNPF